MRHVGVLSVCAALAAAAAVVAIAPAGAAGPPPSSQSAKAGAAPKLPTSMAAIGDSITQAFDSLGSKGFLKSEPGLSWATGFSSRAKVNSQYLRLLAVDPAIRGHEHNDSVVGATISGVGAQVAEAISQHAQYVVVLIGANDLCTHTVSEMTPLRTFAETFATDLATLISGLPKSAHITVYSIPNLFRLWSLFHSDAAANFAWTYTPTGICQSMLAKKGTNEDRDAVLAREKAFNAALAAACAKYSTCKWDRLTVFNERYSAGDVNTLDYFHPSVSGQNRLAALTWSASWWPAFK